MSFQPHGTGHVHAAPGTYANLPIFPSPPRHYAPSLDPTGRLYHSRRSFYRYCQQNSGVYMTWLECRYGSKGGVSGSPGWGWTHRRTWLGPGSWCVCYPSVIDRRWIWQLLKVDKPGLKLNGKVTAFENSRYKSCEMAQYFEIHIIEVEACITVMGSAI